MGKEGEEKGVVEVVMEMAVVEKVEVVMGREEEEEKGVVEMALVEVVMGTAVVEKVEVVMG
jgi:hypothetical protein